MVSITGVSVNLGPANVNRHLKTNACSDRFCDLPGSVLSGNSANSLSVTVLFFSKKIVAEYLESYQWHHLRVAAHAAITTVCLQNSLNLTHLKPCVRARVVPLFPCPLTPEQPPCAFIHLCMLTRAHTHIHACTYTHNHTWTHTRTQEPACSVSHHLPFWT